MVIRLALRPPGLDSTDSGEHVVRLQSDARMPMDRISAWVQEEQAKLPCCGVCGEPVQVRRLHYWRGIPQHHKSCWIRELTRRKMASVQGAFYTGSQAARRLGIGQTSLNRWIKNGKAPQPAKVDRGMNLFDREAIDRLARKLGR